ncbi:Cullin-3, putative [Perkinsus marinus ATCC 50983]|uniref:Cullin-5 n=1 Tax=Perkinsus marinus (strain ATCC 50983 / TXsc) TaxID=423536 RepID=C5LU04_PERM5|nr:Cullin-3, putative [Perkinsus marinus ATCC 50983]EEQ99802.1 Cullin-3, putative [Perkinsus marinus ATCC 50983]|eukprot:XP_002767085.1 Cullin-3, putative [Perkinsus marinus ATCC 50983]
MQVIYPLKSSIGMGWAVRYNLVLHKYGMKLYKGVEETVALHLMEVSKRCIESADEDLLARLKIEWEDHKMSMGMIRDILMYMDRNYVRQHTQQCVPVYDMGLRLFRDTVIGDARVRGRAIGQILAELRRELHGETITDPQLVKSALSMLVELSDIQTLSGHTETDSENVYYSWFEVNYLALIRDFYTQEANEYIERHTVGEYLEKADSRMRQERERVETYMDRTLTMAKVEVLDSVWIGRHYKMLIQQESSGCKVMFAEARVSELRLMYSLFSRIPETLTDIAEIMQQSIGAAIADLIADEATVNAPVCFVEKLLALRQKFEGIVSQAFRGSLEFSNQMKVAFEKSLNNSPKCAYYLSLYLDELLRKRLKDMTDAEFHSNVDQVISVFRYLIDKDVFESYYRTSLCRRLLNSKYESDSLCHIRHYGSPRPSSANVEEAEKLVVSKLRAECGQQYTSKLEGMLKDVSLTRCEGEGVYAFRAVLGAYVYSVSLAQVCTSGFWPTHSPPGCEIPVEMKCLIDRFETFYLSKHSGRRLTWMFNYGTADVRSRVGRHPYVLTVSTYQAMILLLFNSSDALSVDERSEREDNAEIKRHLMSLYVNPKVRVLLRESLNASKEPTAGDIFRVNAEFESRVRSVKVHAGGGSASSVEVGSAVPQAVEEDRKHIVEAVLVRIMKSRKQLDHNSLVVEATRQLSQRFLPAPQLIKQRIEHLIEREFLERCPHDHKTYNYLA